ncbi:MAG: hypothetical protein LUG99_09350 [Lachnospiraceae bacterium]|nr:hypothetical protein [Lachnospiraceae bacterium]
MITVDRKSISYYVIVYYLLIMSGSLFGHFASDSLAKINAVVTVALIFYVVFVSGIPIRRDLVSAFLVISVFTYIFRILWWNELGSIMGYVGDILILISFILWAYVLDYKLMIKAFINIMLWMAIFSIIGYVFYDNLVSLAVPVLGSSWKYHFFGIFSIREVGSGSIRSNGLFWEPGMFQGYLIFSMMLLAVKRNRNRMDWIKLIIFALAILTTQSTTGYLLLIVIIMLLVTTKLNQIEISSKWGNQLQWFLLLVSVLCVVVAFINPNIMNSFLSLFPENVTGKLLETDNISTNSRFYGMLYDIRIALNYPLGIGRNVSQQLLSEQMSISGVEILGRTSSWTTALIMDGLIGGVMYICIYIRGCFKFSEDNFINGIYICIIMATIVNTEPHYGCLFFNMIVVMWYLNKDKDFKLQQDIDQMVEVNFNSED